MSMNDIYDYGESRPMVRHAAPSYSSPQAFIMVAMARGSEFDGSSETAEVHSITETTHRTGAVAVATAIGN